MSNLIETIHPLPEAEHPIEQAVCAAIAAHIAGFPGSLRESYDAMTEQTPIAADVTAEQVGDGPVQGWWLRPESAPADRAILFIHGGAYMLGSARAYRGFASQIAARTGVATFVVEYPLAPEQPFPAAFDAVLAAKKWLNAQGFAQIALTGDSAGGALSLALLADDIASAVVFSPWTDLTFTGPSFLDPNTYDPIFKPVILTSAAEKYLAGADAKDGRASPLHAIPDNLPPIAIQVGSDELLLDDARRYATAAAAKGGEVRLDIYQGLHHVFQRSTEELPSARNALDAAAQFLSDHWK